MSHAPTFPHQPGYPRSWRGRPHRLVPAERALLTWWLDHEPMRIDELWFDVPLDGTPAAAGADSHAAQILDPEWLRVWQRQRARRADVIMRSGKMYRVIELRSIADTQTVGEVLIYDQMIRAEHPNLIVMPAIVITQQVRPGVAAAIHQAKFRLVVAPADLYDSALTHNRFLPTLQSP